MTLHAIRHAAAGHRDDSDPNDLARPLTRRGTAQATALVERFAGVRIEAIVSSPAPRCRQTVAPIAASHQLDIVESPLLLEGTSPSKVLSLVESWGATLSDPEAGDIVMCSHGDVIPDLIRAMQRRGMTVQGSCGWEKASTWSLDGWDGTSFRTAGYTPPPPTERT